MLTGYLLVDKPVGPSSHAAVQQVRRALGIGGRRGTRAGHAGTLDPFASGLLVVLVGRATRLMQYVVGHDKRYVVDIAFGASSDTDDRTGTMRDDPAPRPDRAQVEHALDELRRTTSQVPPAVSAIHIDGERAYRRVRRGEEIDVPARNVRFDAIELVDWIEPRSRAGAVAFGPVARVDVRCATGTYIRSLARDCGELVGCSAHANELRRLEVGEWSVTAARAPHDVSSADLLPALDLVPRLERVQLDDVELLDVVRGKRIAAGALAARTMPGDEVALVGPAGTLAAIAVVTPDRCQLQPRTVLAELPSAAADRRDTPDIHGGAHR